MSKPAGRWDLPVCTLTPHSRTGPAGKQNRHATSKDGFRLLPGARHTRSSRMQSFPEEQRFCVITDSLGRGEETQRSRVASPAVSCEQQSRAAGQAAWPPHQDLPSPGAMDVLGWVLPCGSSPGPCGKLSDISGLHPLGAHSTECPRPPAHLSHLS